MVRMPGIDGHETDVVLPQSGWQRTGVMCCGSCFPCFIPPLWSDDKKHQYIGLFKSFSFVISLIQARPIIVHCTTSLACLLTTHAVCDHR
jgi:hypothetical protein